MGMYRAVQSTPESVKNLLNEYQSRYNSLSSDKEKCDYYYALREQFNGRIRDKRFDDVEAALLIFLNKAGFNGLYRVIDIPAS